MDSKSSSRPAGTARAVDRAFVRRVVRESAFPWSSREGLNPGNVAETVREVRPAVVDVISGVEGPGHIKDRALMAALVAAVRGA